jgi:hypothetical protein
MATAVPRRGILPRLKRDRKPLLTWHPFLCSA